jgi:hypothetical protein
MTNGFEARATGFDRGVTGLQTSRLQSTEPAPVFKPALPFFKASGLLDTRRIESSTPTRSFGFRYYKYYKYYKDDKYYPN